MNKSVEIVQTYQEIKFERARFRSSNEREVNARNVMLNKNSRTLRYIQDEETVTVDLSSLTNLKYSNTNLSRFGEIFGGALGLFLPLILIDDGNPSKGGDSFTGFDGWATVFAVAVAVPVGVVLGHNIGDRYYINWQEYPINRNESVAPHVYNTPPSKTIFLRWKIPLHRF